MSASSQGPSGKYYYAHIAATVAGPRRRRRFYRSMRHEYVQRLRSLSRSLVVETATVWPDEYDAWEPALRHQIAERLHAEPRAASEMDYVRLHTGFCRQITVTQADVERVK